MDHCVICGRLIIFTGALNNLNECEECEAERLEREADEDEDIPPDTLISQYNKSVAKLSKM